MCADPGLRSWEELRRALNGEGPLSLRSSRCDAERKATGSEVLDELAERDAHAAAGLRRRRTAERLLTFRQGAFILEAGDAGG
jgi:hypothetical protein